MGVRLGVIVQQTVTTNPIIYGPSLGAMLSIPLGETRPQVRTLPWGREPWPLTAGPRARDIYDDVRLNAPA